MRIGIDATALPARPVGAGNYIIQLIRAIARHNQNDHESPGSSQADQLEFFIFVQQSRVELLKVEESPGLNLVIVPDLSPFKRILWEQVSFPRLAKSYQLDLLHCLHYTMPLAYRGRVVVTFHDMTFFLFPKFHTLPKRYFFRFFIRRSTRKAVALIADSESTRQDAIRLVGLPPEKIFTVRLGVTQEFRHVQDPFILDQARQKYHLPQHFLLFVGMLEPRKNLPSLLQAYASIASQVQDYQMVIVGRKGWMAEDIQDHARKLGISNRVHFTGYVEQEDLPLIYNMAQVFIYPSVYEGFGLPVLESMACGTPVITYNVSSMPEIVGDSGVLLSQYDTGTLAEALLELINHPDKRQHLSTNGLKRASIFTWDQTAEKTIEIYRRVLSAG
jgi:glycosyltransferase involved in cell wall biosynthesis